MSIRKQKMASGFLRNIWKMGGAFEKRLSQKARPHTKTI